MVHFRSHTVADVVLVEFIVPGIYDGPEIEEISEELHEMIGRSVCKRMIIEMKVDSPVCVAIASPAHRADLLSSGDTSADPNRAIDRVEMGVKGEHAGTVK